MLQEASTVLLPAKAPFLPGPKAPLLLRYPYQLSLAGQCCLGDTTQLELGSSYQQFSVKQ